MPRLPLFVVRKFLAMHVDAAVGTSIEDMRVKLDALAQRMPKLKGVSHEPTTVAGLAGEWSRPAECDEDRAVLFLHGGGYQVGSLDSHRDLAGRVARAARAPTLAINYRLAPEHPYPAALEDVVAVYRELIQDHGIAPSKLAFVGDSAGGGLAICATLYVRDGGELPLPGALACMSAWTDLSCSSPSLMEAGDPTVKPEYVKEMADIYLAGQDPKTPLASPLFADVRGLPPTLLQVGGREALLDDSRRFAAHCETAGVDVTLDVWDGMFHAFQVWAAMLGGARAAINEIGQFVARHTGGTAPARRRRVVRGRGEQSPPE